MASPILPGGERFASPVTFTTALARLTAADARLDRLGLPAACEYRDALERLIETPAPDLNGLVAKIAAADPMCLDHHAAILADARRLAGSR